VGLGTIVYVKLGEFVVEMRLRRGRVFLGGRVGFDFSRARRDELNNGWDGGSEGFGGPLHPGVGEGAAFEEVISKWD
jgi:hypothetical protein